MSDEGDKNDFGVVNLVKMHEPRLDIKADREFVALMGAANISTRQYSADSASTGQIIWSQTTPSVRVGVDRTILMDITFDIDISQATVTGVQSSQNPAPDASNTQLVFSPDCLNQLNNFGPRAFPLHSVIEVINLRLNDQQFSWEPADLIHGLLEYGNDAYDRQLKMGSTAHYPDQIWTYGGGLLNVAASTQRNPFNLWMDSTDEDARSGSIWFNFDPSRPTHLTLRCIEQIMMSPMTWAQDAQCLFGIQSIDVSVTFKSPLQKILSGYPFNSNLLSTQKKDAGNATPALPVPELDNVNFNWNISVSNQTSTLHITYLQPQADQIIGSRLNYPYNQVRKWSQNIPDKVAAGAVMNEVFYNNIQLHEIPARMILFAKPYIPNKDNFTYRNLTAIDLQNPVTRADYLNNAFSPVTTADFFAAIDKVQISFDTQDGRLSTLDSADLWTIASRNGYKRSFKSWDQYLGSVLALEFGTDLNLNPLLCPSVRGSFQLAVQVKYRDIRDVRRIPKSNPDGINYQTGLIEYKAYLITVPTGIMTIENQLISVSIGSVQEVQVLNAPWVESGARREMANFYGEGVSFKNIWKGIKKVGKVVGPSAGPIASVVHDLTKNSNSGKAQMAHNVASIVKAATGRGRKLGGKAARANSLSRRL